MGDTYTHLHVHAVFAVKYRASLINKGIKQRVQSYITAIMQNHGHKMLCIYAMPDHLHMLFGQNPSQAISDIMRIVKCESSEWINKNNLSDSKFRWQEGYGAF